MNWTTTSIFGLFALASVASAAQAEWLEDARSGVVISGHSVEQFGPGARTVTGDEPGWTRIERSVEGLDLWLEWRSEGHRIWARSGVRNNRATPIHIDSLEVLSGTVRAPHGLGHVLQFNRRNSGRGRHPLFPEVEQGGVYGTATDRPSLAGMFLTSTRAFGLVTVRPERQGLRVRAFQTTDGVRLDSGRVRSSEVVVLSRAPNPAQELEHLAELSGRASGYRVPAHIPTNWCTWYSGLVWPKTRDGALERDVLRNAEAIARDWLPYGLDLIRIVEDSPYEGDEDWPLVTNPLPNGYRALAERLASMGLRAGYWFDNTRIFVGGKWFREHPEMLSRNPDGSVRIVGTGEGYRDHAYLDGSTSGGREAYEELGRKFDGVGMQYVFADFTWQSLLRPGQSSDPTLTSVEVARAAMEAARQGFGDMFWLTQQMHAATFGLADASRVSYDSWGDQPNAYRDSLNLWFLHGRTTLVDPDAWMPARHELEWDRAWGSWQALAGFPMTLGGDMTALPPDRAKLMRTVLPVLHLPGRPLDLWERRTPMVVATPIHTGGDRWTVVGLFNWRSYPLRATLDLRRAFAADFSSGREARGYLALDAWVGEFLGEFARAVDLEIPARGCRVVVLRESTGRPQVLAVGSHLSRGARELRQVAWDADRMRLVGLGQVDDLIVHLPEGWRLVEARVDDRAAAVKVGKHVLRLQGESGREVRWSVRFRRVGATPAPEHQAPPEELVTLAAAPIDFSVARPEEPFVHDYLESVGGGLVTGEPGSWTPESAEALPKLWYDWTCLAYRFSPWSGGQARVGVTLFDHDSQLRRVRVSLCEPLTGRRWVVARDLAVPHDAPKTFWFAVPRDFGADGGVQIELVRLAGANATALDFRFERD